MKREPVVVVMSIIAGLSVLFGAFVTSQEAALVAIGGYGMMAVGAVTAAVQFYVRGEVTPNISVTELVPGIPKKGAPVVAGPANDLITPGTTVRNLGEPPPAEIQAQELQQDVLALEAEKALLEQQAEVPVTVQAEHVGDHRPERFASDDKVAAALHPLGTLDALDGVDGDSPVVRWCGGCGREHAFSRDGAWADHDGRA